MNTPQTKNQIVESRTLFLKVFIKKMRYFTDLFCARERTWSQIFFSPPARLQPDKVILAGNDFSHSGRSLEKFCNPGSFIFSGEKMNSAFQVRLTLRSGTSQS
jgi:hypothetical protein